MNKPSSRQWLKEHNRDAYVQQARHGGYRSRAAYKLIQLDNRERILRAGLRVLDLGAAPGGWSQVAAEAVGVGGRVVAVDRIAIAALPNVDCIQGDLDDVATFRQIMALRGATGFDLVLSDMAPNISGMKAIDQPRSLGLAEDALAACGELLKPGGDFVVKLFQGAGFDEYLQAMRRSFAKVVRRKPPASRDRSSEIYVLAKGYSV